VSFGSRSSSRFVLETIRNRSDLLALEQEGGFCSGGGGGDGSCHDAAVSSVPRRPLGCG
jgi:hypothetical protein